MLHVTTLAPQNHLTHVRAIIARLLGGEIDHVELLYSMWEHEVKLDCGRRQFRFLVWKQQARLWEWHDANWLASNVGRCFCEYLATLLKFLNHPAQTQMPDQLKLLEQLFLKFSNIGYCQRIWKVTSVKFTVSDLGAKVDRGGDEWIPIANGLMLSLRTGEQRERMPTDLWTFALPGTYLGPEGSLRHAEGFFLQVANNDMPLAAYMQKMLGYFLTPATASRKFFYWYGPQGSNGKTTIEELLKSVMGLLYAPADAATVLYRSGRATSHDSHLLALDKKRLGMYSETRPDAVLDDAKIKALTGDGGDLSVRQAGSSEHKSIHLSAKIVIQSNYKPNFIQLDSAIKDRLVLVPFMARFEDNPGPGAFKKSGEFVHLLKTVYLNEVFTWIVRGAHRWYQQPTFEPTPPMQQLLLTYFEEQQDPLGRFVREELEKLPKPLHPRGKPEAALGEAELYSIYQQWATQHHYAVLQMKHFVDKAGHHLACGTTARQPFYYCKLKKNNPQHGASNGVLIDPVDLLARDLEQRLTFPRGGL